jgi:hypothetical protein
MEGHATLRLVNSHPFIPAVIAVMNPILTELCQQPLAFIEGFLTGILRLDPTQEPLKGWLEQQGLSPTDSSAPSSNGASQRGPQNISID